MNTQYSINNSLSNWFLETYAVSEFTTHSKKSQDRDKKLFWVCMGGDKPNNYTSMLWRCLWLQCIPSSIQTLRVRKTQKKPSWLIVTGVVIRLFWDSVRLVFISPRSLRHAASRCAGALLLTTRWIACRATGASWDPPQHDHCWDGPTLLKKKPFENFGIRTKYHQLLKACLRLTISTTTNPVLFFGGFARQHPLQSLQPLSSSHSSGFHLFKQAIRIPF